MTYNPDTQGLIEYSAGNYINCHSLPLAPNQEIVTVETDGNVVSNSSSVISMQPVFTGTTYDIDSLIGYTGLSAVSSTGVKIYYQTALQQGIRHSDHTLLTVAKTFTTIDSITVSQGSLATATFTVHALSTDGTAETMAETRSALPDYSDISQKYTLGEVTIPDGATGTTLLGVQSWTINFAPNVFKNLSDGKVYPNFASLVSQAPTATITTNNAAQAQTILLTTKCGSTILRLRETDCTVGAGVKTFTAANSQATYGGRSSNQGSINSVDINVTFNNDQTDSADRDSVLVIS